VEVAAYRIAQEAVTNAVRHSDARRIDVVLERTEGTMSVQVQDDGGGIRPDARRGVGLASMRERASELGGWCTVEAAGAGTLVTARLPVDPA
jgi:signal transduction histidine kinase